MPSTIREMMLDLTRKISAYDRRYNNSPAARYRLAHYFGAVEKVEADLRAAGFGDAWDLPVTPAVITAIKRSLAIRFIPGGLAPVDRFVKNLDG